VERARGDPYMGEPLHGRCRGLYRLRKGRLRLAYWLDTEHCVVRIAKIGYRECIRRRAQGC